LQTEGIGLYVLVYRETQCIVTYTVHSNVYKDTDLYLEIGIVKAVDVDAVIHESVQ